MKRLALLVLAASFALPGAARGAACSPLDCAPSQFALGHGLMGFRSMVSKPVTVVDLRTGARKWVLPAGLTGGNLLVHQAGRNLAWYDATRGAHLYDVTLPSVEYSLAGLSQNGSRAVLSRFSPKGTRFLVASRHGQRTLVVPGARWQFDALRGRNLILIHDIPTGGYQVRLFDLVSNRLVRQPLKDPHESATIWGSPFERLSSADGRYLFTLYIGPNGGSMIHELDLQNATARCIDLPGTGDYSSATSWGLVLAPGQRKILAVSPGYGRVVAIDVRAARVVSSFRIDLPYWNTGNVVTAAIAPDGRRLALANGEQVAVVGLGRRRIVSRHANTAIAVGFSPDGARLWTLS
ncbi:MAG: hypothetical protein ACRDM1_05485 [Gaiellaceae bacterium]